MADSASPTRRWLALLSLLLLVLVPQAHSVLQHGASLHTIAATPAAASPDVSGKDASRWDADDSLCMLCSVLGSATQPASYHAARPVEQALKVPAGPGESFVLERWYFEQFSRPPPAGLSAPIAG